MNLSDEAIRKAAILVAALDTAAADALLESMDEALAARVRASYMELDDVDVAEQQRVIEQFMIGDRAKARDAAAPAPSAAEMADTLDLSSAVRLREYLSLAQERDAPALETNDKSAAQHESDFDFLASASGEQLAAALRCEHPQAIAVVLTHVTPSTAAAALARLPVSTQADVARRIVDLDQIDGEMLAELQAGLRETIGATWNRLSREGSGLAALKRIWAEASATEKMSLQRGLRECESQLLIDLTASQPVTSVDGLKRKTLAASERSQAARLHLDRPAEPPIRFEALGELDNASLGRVLQEAPSRELLLALAGANATFIDRVYRQLPRREARILRKQIEQQGPIALRDVAEAQRRLSLLAAKLAAAGDIEIPGTRRFTMAA